MDDLELEAKESAMLYRTELDSSQHQRRSETNGSTHSPLHWGTRTPPTAEIDQHMSHSTVRSLSSDFIHNSDIPGPNHNPIQRKPLADSPAAPQDVYNLDAPQSTTAMPSNASLPAILRPGIPPPALSASPPGQRESHTPQRSAEPSVSSFAIDAAGTQDGGGLVALQRKYERVREERERLNKLQELTELEEQLRRRIEEELGRDGQAGTGDG
jgi:hypothetical protein